MRATSSDSCENLRFIGLRRTHVPQAPTSFERIHLQEGHHSPEGNELWLNWTLRIRSSGTVVGYLQASICEESADLAWVIGIPFQNRGYATEAGRRATSSIRECLKVSELRAAIHPDHAASCRVVAHIGLQPSGQLTDQRRNLPGIKLWRGSLSVVPRCTRLLDKASREP